MSRAIEKSDSVKVLATNPFIGNDSQSHEGKDEGGMEGRDEENKEAGRGGQQ